MPKAKAAPEYPANGADYQLDPLIEALLGHLPAPGDVFLPADRKRWLAIMEQALGLVYLETEPEGTDQQDAAT
jgi:hypothetical protein